MCVRERERENQRHYGVLLSLAARGGCAALPMSSEYVGLGYQLEKVSVYQILLHISTHLITQPYEYGAHETVTPFSRIWHELSSLTPEAGSRHFTQRRSKKSGLNPEP